MGEQTLHSLFYFNKTQSILKFSRPSRAWVYYRDKKIDLVKQQVFASDTQQLENYFSKLPLFGQELRSRPRVIHVNYNYGHILLKGSVGPEVPLLVDIEYEQVEPVHFKTSSNDFRVHVQGPRVEEYAPRFQKCYEALLRGDSYQLNLTAPFVCKFEEQNFSQLINFFFSQPKQLGAYAHATTIPFLNLGLLSNSPECLFQASLLDDRSIKLLSMPIKGTLRVSDESERKKINQQLFHDKKNQNELFIIIDLIRNDLSKIERPIAKLVAKKIPLSVPGLAHLASIISVDLSRHVSIAQVLAALFPGGSITGAPKIRTMQILESVENYDRGFYTGSTILMWQKMAAASINIRTLQFDLNSNSGIYGAGGAITLQSEMLTEYEEMLAKVESFVGMFSLGPQR